MEPTADRPTVFISYSHADERWKNRLVKHLQVLALEGLWDLWDDRRISAGSDWQPEIEAAMARARVAVLLISADFLTSGFIRGTEVPEILRRRKDEGLLVIPVIVHSCPWQAVPWLSRIQCRPMDGRELASFPKAKAEKHLSALALEIRALLAVPPPPGRNSGSSGGQHSKESGGEGLHRVPPPTRHFQGRDQELKDCLAALRSSPLVSVVGLPGIGKTELTHAAAHAALADPELRLERAFWFSLAGMRSVDELRNRLAVAFAVSEYKQIEDLAHAIGGQHVLLVLDNAEDLITVSADTRLDFQDFCGKLLRSCPGLRFLLSTRRALGSVEAAEEIEVRVGRLQPPHDLAVFQAAASPRLTSQEKSSTELTKLVQTLEGHALSLTLVAGRVGRGMSLAALRQQLVEDGDAAVVAHEFLGTSESEWSADERLRTKRLMSSLNLSFSPLASKHPDAAETFIWLGLFPAGLLASLVSPLFGDRGEEQVALLSEHNLVERLGDPERLVLPAPVRWYGAREMARISGERQHALLAATFHALGLLLFAAYERAATEHASGSFSLALSEEPNLASLLTTVSIVGIPTTPELTDGIASALVPWLHLQSLAGRLSPAISLGEQAAAITASSLEIPTHAEILHALGDLYAQTNRLREAEQSYRSALPIFQRNGVRLGEANTLHALGDLYARTSRLCEAEQSYQSALPIYQQIETRLGEANTRQALGDLYVRTYRLREAEQSYQSSRSIYQQIKDQLGESNVLQALGNLYVRTSRLLEAEQNYQGALSIYRQIQARLGEATTLRALGDLYVRTSRLREAEQSYQSALPIFPQIEDRLGEANTLQALGDLYVRTSRLREAEQSYQRALLISQQIEAQLSEANTLQGFGDLALAQGDLQKAFDCFVAALQIQRTIADLLGAGGSQGHLARTARRANNLERAVVLGGRSWTQLKTVANRFGQSITLDELISCFEILKDEKGFASSLILAWHLAKTMEEPSAEKHRDRLRQILPDFNPESNPVENWLPEVEETLTCVLERYEQALKERGEDPHSPLKPRNPEPVSSEPERGEIT